MDTTEFVYLLADGLWVISRFWLLVAVHILSSRLCVKGFHFSASVCFISHEPVAQFCKVLEPSCTLERFTCSTSLST